MDTCVSSYLFCSVCVSEIGIVVMQDLTPKLCDPEALPKLRDPEAPKLLRHLTGNEKTRQF